MTKKAIPPEHTGRPNPDSPAKETQNPSQDHPQPLEIDIDDAQIEEPKDDVFRKSAKPVEAPKRRKKA